MMALDLDLYRVTTNGSNHDIIGRDLKLEGVFLEEKAAKVRPSGMIPAAYHLHSSRWVGVRMPGV